nr:hypothetical protein [Tanacetum cinerariifolium]
MYNVDLKNIIPSGDLTCLFVKAILDESNLWHRRLGHINFKTMNKLVKGKLVRGLPSKVFKTMNKLVKGLLEWTTWLFDIDTLTQSMNYQQVVAGNQPNSSADADAAFADIENESEVHVSLSSSDKPKKHDEKPKREAKGKSHVDLKSSFADPSQYPDNPNMHALEDITYSDDEEDVGAETDFSNLETNITVSLIPTTRVHKDHPVTQIIGDLSLAPQTRRGASSIQDAKGFEDPEYPDKVYKVVKALYGLHQALRACYETLANYLLENGFQKGKIDQTLFIKKQKGDILLVHVYVDDIIFGSTNKDLCKAFEKLMKDKFQITEVLRKFSLTDEKSASTPIDTKKPLLKDSNVEDVDVHTYRSMIGSLMYLTSSRPDIMFVVCACTYFYVTPKASHLHAVKRILAMMGYEKPSTKLTFYKAFFSAQWKFLIHTILQCISAKRTAWNEFSSFMASAIIYLATGVDTPLFDVMLVQQQVQDVEDAAEDEDDDHEVSAEPTPPSHTPVIPSPSPTQEHIPSPPQSQTAQPSSPLTPQLSQTVEILMTLLHTLLETCAILTKQVANLEQDKVA